MNFERFDDQKPSRLHRAIASIAQWPTRWNNWTERLSARHRHRWGHTLVPPALEQLETRALLALPVLADQTTTFDDLEQTGGQAIPDGTVIDDLSYDGWQFVDTSGQTRITPASGRNTGDVA